jgi:hypothetical protein
MAQNTNERTPDGVYLAFEARNIMSVIQVMVRLIITQHNTRMTMTITTGVYALNADSPRYPYVYRDEMHK